jgi:hypothetical protein
MVTIVAYSLLATQVPVINVPSPTGTSFTDINVSENVGTLDSGFRSTFGTTTRLRMGVQILPVVYLNTFGNPITSTGVEINAYRDSNGDLQRNSQADYLSISTTEMADLALKVKNQGFKFVRTDMTWSSVMYYTQDDFTNFGAYVDLVNAMAAQGIKTLFVLRAPNNKFRVNSRTATSFAPTFGASFFDIVSTIQRDKFADFAGRAATQFANNANVAFEITNEANTKSFFDGQYTNPLQTTIDDVRSGEDVGLTIRAALSKMRQNWAGVTVISGGTFTTPPTFLGKVVDYKRSTVAGGGILNGIGIHPYSTVEPEAQLGQGQTGAFDPFGTVRGIVNARNVTGNLGKPAVSVTEIGHSSTLFDANGNGDGTSQNFDGTTGAAEHRQSVYAIRNVLSMWTKSSKLTSVYEFVNHPVNLSGSNFSYSATNDQANYGLMNYDASQVWANGRLKAHGVSGEKKAGKVLRILADKVNQDFPAARRWRGFNSGTSDLNVIYLGPGKYIAWLRKPTASIGSSVDTTALTVFFPGGATATDMVGVTKTVTAVTGSNPGIKVTFSEDQGPIYVGL